MLFIRTDGNDVIASGHIMRCLSIADALKERGEDSTFLIADRQAEGFITERGYPVICLNSRWDDWDAECGMMEGCIKKYGIERLLIDSYYVTKRYLERMQELTKVIYIDDIHSFHYPVHMLISYFVNSSGFDYEREYAGTDTKLLLGCRYAPLRKEFSAPPITIRGQVRDILLTSGGSDSYNLLGGLVRKLMKREEFKALRIHIISGRYNVNYKELQNIAKENRNICLYQNASNVAEIMHQCDIAVSAAGTTLLELCACGIPTIAYVLADNQRYGMDAFQKEHIMLYAGDVREDREKVLSQIVSCLKELMGSRLLRSEMAKNMNRVTDGHGAGNIAEELLKL